jgi:hypothetical protein
MSFPSSRRPSAACVAEAAGPRVPKPTSTASPRAPPPLSPGRSTLPRTPPPSRPSSSPAFTTRARWLFAPSSGFVVPSSAPPRPVPRSHRSQSPLRPRPYHARHRHLRPRPYHARCRHLRAPPPLPPMHPPRPTPTPRSARRCRPLSAPLPNRRRHHLLLPTHRPRGTHRALASGLNPTTPSVCTHASSDRRRPGPRAASHPVPRQLQGIRITAIHPRPQLRATRHRTRHLPRSATTKHRTRHLPRSATINDHQAAGPPRTNASVQSRGSPRPTRKSRHSAQSMTASNRGITHPCCILSSTSSGPR